MTTIYYPVPAFADALADVIADVRSEFPTWDADPSDPGYYIAELIAQQRIDNRTMINESRKALIWPITPGVDGASGDDLLELARSVSIDSKLPDETDGELLRRMNDRWVGLSETDERVRLLVLDTLYQYTASGASEPTTFRVIDVSTEDGSGYDKTIYIQTDLSRAPTNDERQAVEQFLDGPTGSPWYVIPTVSAETRTPYDLTAKIQYRGNLAELEPAVRGCADGRCAEVSTLGHRAL